MLMEGKINVDHNYIWTCKRGSIGRGGGRKRIELKTEVDLYRRGVETVSNPHG